MKEQVKIAHGGENNFIWNFAKYGSPVAAVLYIFYGIFHKIANIADNAPAFAVLSLEKTNNTSSPNSISSSQITQYVLPRC